MEVLFVVLITKNTMLKKGSKLLKIAIIVTIIAFVLNLLAYLGLR
ncbi:hypothetical protein SA21311_2447 [Staphylococcus aureus subsp. aureus 21311]|nr:hypothetical protein SA21311_2447 [Staphylococcus aureus subsp. aureus 21311]